jgi:hypothetical protein
MSDKNKIIVAESLLPADLTTATMGKNYLMEGYEDLQYGMGVLEGVKDPDLLPPPAVPTGLSREGADYLPVQRIIEDIPVNDLSWLEGGVQDLDRLPNKQKSLDSIHQLQQLWGENRAMTQKSAYEVDLGLLRDRGEVGVRSSKTINKTEIARRASRRLIAKTASAEIAREAVLSAGGDEAAVRPIVDAVERDRGLAGNVFIRIASFPNYGQGKWKDFVNQHAKAARYIIADEQTIKSATWINDGRCDYTGKQVVTSVPWKAAYELYAPRLKAAGYAVAPAGKDPRKALQEAFLKGPQAKVAQSALPVHEGQIEKLGKSSFNGEAALQAFEKNRTKTLEAKIEKVRARVAAGEKGEILRKRVASMFAPSEVKEAAPLLIPILRGALRDDPRQVRVAQEVASVDEVRSLNKPLSIDGDRVVETLEGRKFASVESKVQAIQERIDNGEKGEILRRRVASMFAPSEQAEAARLLAPFAQAFKETSSETRFASTTEKRADNLLGFGDSLDKPLSPQEEAAVQARVAKVEARVKSGESGEVLRRRIASMFSPREQVLASKLLAPIVRGHLADKPREVRVAKDSGERIQNIGPKNEELALAKKASAGSEKIARVRGAVGWVRRAMNEGFAGKNLDDAIRSRFTESLLKEANDNIAKIRAAHEGLAGFRYVDASVYASKDGGVKGCEDGGLKHRANQVKMVLGMDRCGSCAMANTLPDGSTRCSVYNKMLVRASEFNAADLRKAKAAAIKQANSHDAEHTASLFAPRFDPNEFNLHNAALDNVRADDLPEQEKINDIVMGGLIF